MPDCIRQKKLPHLSALFLLILCALTAFGVPVYSAPSFVDAKGDPLTKVTVSNGVADLVWSDASVPEGGEFELQQALAAEFADPILRYAGPDRSSVLTGLPEGEHFFRVREEGTEEWSAPLSVTVKFIGRGQLLALLTVGFLVVAATIGTIIAGYMKEVKGGEV